MSGLLIIIALLWLVAAVTWFALDRRCARHLPLRLRLWRAFTAFPCWIIDRIGL